MDRYSGWLSVYQATKDGTAGFTMKEYFSTYGIAKQVTSDGGPQYTSHSTQKFFKAWGISHRISSSYFPHSNQRAEQGVKSAKRMLRENIGADGSLNTDRFGWRVTFEVVDTLTGSSSLAGRLFEEQPHELYRKWKVYTGI